MHLRDSISLALQSSLRHPLRTLLAALCVAIGVGALVTILSGEQAWRKALDGWYQLRGVDVVRAQTLFAGRPLSLPESQLGLSQSRDDTRRLLAACPAISAATPVADATLTAKYGRASDGCRVRGMLPGFERIFGTRLIEGRFFTTQEETERAAVCIADADFARVVLKEPRLLGKDIHVGGHRLRVIGIADKLWAGGLRGPTIGYGGELYRARGDYISYMDAGIAVPLSTARRTMGIPVRWLAARAADHATALPQIARFLGLDPATAVKEGILWSLAAEKKQAVQARRRVQLFVGLAAMLILFSSGVGIASLMYISVSERQQEIGIHRACGATRGAIASTFLLASVLLGALGALAGLGLGVAGTHFLGTVSFPNQASGGPGDAPITLATSVLPDMRVAVDWPALAVAILAALLASLLAGYAPASEAASLDPSRAISAERVSRYRLRRAFTALQLTVGIAAVLLLSAIHEGIALEQLGSIASFSQADTVMTDVTLTYSSAQMAAVANPVKDLVRDPEQVKAIARECPAFKSVESQLLVYGPSIKRGRYVLGEQLSIVTAVTEGYFAAEGLHLIEGRFFTPEEMRAGRPVAVITDGAAAALELETAAGQEIRIGGLPFTVVGTVARGAEFGDASQSLYLPVTSVPKSWTAGYPYTGAKLRAHLRSKSNYRTAEHQFLTALSKRLPPLTMQHLELHGNIPDRVHLSGMRRSAAVRASIIGFSALLIALIGLVNMLLVSVSEQTREIGLRRALGATRPAIALGVVLEAVLICLPGCVAGLGLGIAAAHSVGGWAKLATAVPMFWVMVSAGAALMGGLLASLIPAARAALVDPVVALRHE